MENTTTTTAAGEAGHSPINADVSDLLKRIATTFNIAHGSNRSQLVLLDEVLRHWRLHGDSRPIRLFLTRANGKGATRIKARTEKLQSVSIINRIVSRCVDGVKWSFDATEQTGMKNPVNGSLIFNMVELDRLAALVAKPDVTIISKDVREAFPAERKTNPTIAQRVAAETKWCKDNGVTLGDLIKALQDKAKDLAKAA